MRGARMIETTIAAAVVALIASTTGCADTDPTSLPSAGRAQAAADPAPTDPAPEVTTTVLLTTTTSTTLAPTTVPPTTAPAPTTPAPTTTPPPATTDPAAGDGAAAGTDDELLPIGDDGEPVDLSAFVTDDPTFDVEPLQPFEVAAVQAVDDTGLAQPTGWTAFDASLEDALLRNGNTAVSVAVSIGGDVVHSAAFGFREPLLSTDPAEPRDRFRIASISKPITAIALLQLVEDGVVGLDDPVGQLIADQLGVTPSNGARQVTVRRLLNHTSGFGKYDSQFFRKASDDCEDAARTGMTRGVGGGGYRYSNMNYCVAGVLIEALTGTTYETAAYTHVLTPLGLSGLRLANTVDPGPDEILHFTSEGRNYMETLGAAGSWIATPTDLVTIMDSLDPSTPGVKPLEPETLELMKTPVNGQLGQRGYGLGLISYGPGRYGHTGTIENTHAMTMNRGDGVTWSITVAGPYPSNTPRLESFINRAFEAAGFIAG
ncbi:MAG: beta-lactamase family protein [Ilumatobacter sp.]|nr:beta-lactamase family protein [Ilumatobacter sp.]